MITTQCADGLQVNLHITGFLYLKYTKRIKFSTTY